MGVARCNTNTASRHVCASHRGCACPYALTPNTVELTPTLEALFPRGGAVQEPVRTVLTVEIFLQSNIDLRETFGEMYGGRLQGTVAVHVQGYLAQKKPPPPLGPS